MDVLDASVAHVVLEQASHCAQHRSQDQVAQPLSLQKPKFSVISPQIITDEQQYDGDVVLRDALHDLAEIRILTGEEDEYDDDDDELDDEDEDELDYDEDEEDDDDTVGSRKKASPKKSKDKAKAAKVLYEVVDEAVFSGKTFRALR